MGLVQTLGDLREKNRETERSELLKEIEELKRATQEKANIPEEVAQLGEEIETFKEMLGALE